MNTRIFTPILLATMFSACGMREKVEQAHSEAFEMLADQSFKTSVAVIELYKVRYGVYPPSLDSITYTSAFDDNAFTSVKYERLDTGYRLDLADGFMGKQKSEIAYPAEFWQGTGVKQSNLLK
mgnify:CR=1 FL=1